MSRRERDRPPWGGMRRRERARRLALLLAYWRAHPRAIILAECRVALLMAYARTLGLTGQRTRGGFRGHG